MANARQTPNAEEIPVELVGGSTFGRYPKISAAKTINMYESDGWLVNTAGYQKYAQISDDSGEGRGIFRSVRGGIYVCVIGAGVWIIAPFTEPNLIGNIDTTSGEVFMDENLNGQICLVDGVNAYIITYDEIPSLTLQALGGGLLPTYVTYNNTFFLFGNGATDNAGAPWYAYQYDSPTTIVQNTQFALQTKPDYAIAVERLPGQGNNVLVFGTTVCEIFTQVGGLENYRRNRTINLDYGCISVSTIASSDKYVAWLAVNEANSPVIVVYTGQGAAPISSDGIDHQLDNIQYPAQSTAMFYKIDGHLIYQITFYNPADNLTLIYDFITQKFFNLTDASGNYHPARKVIYFDQELLFISLNNGSIYLMSTDLTTYNENLTSTPALDVDLTLIHAIPRIRICESIRKPDSSRFIANSFVMTLQQGNDANATSQSIYQPTIGLSLSKDGGITFGNIAVRQLNTIGNRQNILNWNNMGQANDLVLKFQFWGTSSFVVNNGVLQIY